MPTFMYASTDQTHDYVTHLEDQGHQLTQAGQTDDVQGYLRMVTIIQERLDPSSTSKRQISAHVKYHRLVKSTDNDCGEHS